MIETINYFYRQEDNQTKRNYIFLYPTKISSFHIDTL